MLKNSFLRFFFIVLFFILTPLSHAFDSRPITFALSVSLTGDNHDIGVPIKNGLLLWQKQLNSQQGILGHPVKLIFADDQSNAQRAAEIYQEYIKDDKVDFLFSPYTSQLTEAVAPIAETAKIPLLATAANSEELWNKGYHYLFGLLQVSTNNSDDFIEILALAGGHKIAIIGVDAPYGRSIVKGAREWANSLGVKVVMDATFTENNEGLKELAAKTAQSKASALIFAGSLTQTLAMRRALAAENITNITFFSASSRAASSYYQTQLGPLADHTITPVWWVKGVEHDSDNISSFKSEYEAMFHRPPSDTAALSYAAGEIFQEAIIRAKSISAEKVRNAILTMNTITVIGRFSVDQNGKQIKHQLFLSQWQNREQEMVWPETLASKKIILEK